MNRASVEVYCGNGHGKTSLAIGKSLQACAHGKSVIMIHFLKGNEKTALEFLENEKGLDYKIFSFEKHREYYETLSEEEKELERRNIINGLNFTRKVVKTQECDFLVMDEILGLLELGIVSEDSLREILAARDPEMHIVLTGRHFPQSLADCVDSVTTLETVQTR